MKIKKELFVWISILIISLLIILLIFKGGITGNPILKVYSIEEFSGIYIDFGPTQDSGSAKWGAAAVGSLGEYWNAPFVNNSQYTYLPLKYSNGDLSDMTIQLSNFDRSGKIKTNLEDVMFESYVYSKDINKVGSILISNLIAGSYDIYLYGNLEESNANYELYGYNFSESETKYTFYGLRSSYIQSDVINAQEWSEGTHYVVYRDVEFGKGDSLEILVKSFDKDGKISNAFISGMQLVRTGTPLAYKPSDINKRVECYDSDGGINYTSLGKIYLNGRISSEDICDNQNVYLNELYCENGLKTIELHKCENGCVDGICVTDVKFLECDGCYYNQICRAKGSRLDNKYCDIDKFLKLQKDENLECENDFECETNSCSDGICDSLDMIARRELGTKYNVIKVICRISNFNNEEYQSCLYDAFSPLLEDKEGNIEVEDNNINSNNSFIINESNPLPEPTL